MMTPGEHADLFFETPPEAVSAENLQVGDIVAGMAITAETNYCLVLDIQYGVRHHGSRTVTLQVLERGRTHSWKIQSGEIFWRLRAES